MRCYACRFDSPNQTAMLWETPYVGRRASEASAENRLRNCQGHARSAWGAVSKGCKIVFSFFFLQTSSQRDLLFYISYEASIKKQYSLRSKKKKTLFCCSRLLLLRGDQVPASFRSTYTRPAFAGRVYAVSQICGNFSPHEKAPLFSQALFIFPAHQLKLGK